MDVVALEAIELQVARFIQTPWTGGCPACQLARAEAARRLLVEWILLDDQDRDTFVVDHEGDRLGDAVLGIVGEALDAGLPVDAAASLAGRRYDHRPNQNLGYARTRRCNLRGTVQDLRRPQTSLRSRASATHCPRPASHSHPA